MRSRRLLLDGPDLQVLLRRAETLGGRVLRAERRRRGLLGRSWYEVTVVVPDSSDAERTPGWQRSPAAAPEVVRAPAGIGDLLAAAEEAERAEAASRLSPRAARTAKGQRGR
ncbi:hypothetical protein [Georgenia sp. H159]|uniref:hypothetical protein n=1 Tax=Georgenia sp. H159 TaxID=3076115 RepID=UPI002D79320F|nr:hypothetical protein [Georgenia sp. H159]